MKIVVVWNGRTVKANILQTGMHRCSEAEALRVGVLDWQEEGRQSAEQEQVDEAQLEVESDQRLGIG